MPTLSELAALLGGTVEGEPGLVVESIAAIEDARKGQLTFLTDPRYASRLGSSAAGAVVAGPGVAVGGKPAIRVPDALAVLPVLLSAFAPVPPEEPGDPVDPTARVHPTARLAGGVRVGAYAVIEANVAVGERSWIGALCVVGWGSSIGRDARLMPHVAVGERTKIGDRVLIHSGTVLGADGFGFLPGPAGPRKIPQIGRVVIGDDVEIGANCTVDRATVGETVIARAVKLDDMVHVAHNCFIGEGTVVAGQTGFSGTVKVGRGCRFGGQSGVADHVTIGDGVEVGAKSGIHRDVPAGRRVFGYPAREAAEAFRINAGLSRLPGLIEKVRHQTRRAGGRDREGK